MRWFKSEKNNNLKNLLKNSGSDFSFDKNSVKFRLLASIRHYEQKPIRHFRFGRVLKYSASFAVLVIILSSSFAFASQSRPGDKLFALNKAGERVVLSLPMPAEQKARVQEYIVTSRFEALDQVTDSRSLATVRETNESLDNAVEQITKNKKALEARGKNDKAEALETVLDKLQTEALEREQIIQKLEDEAKDDDTRLKFHQHLEQIKNTRKKAQAEIRRFQD